MTIAHLLCSLDAFPSAECRNLAVRLQELPLKRCLSGANSLFSISQFWQGTTKLPELKELPCQHGKKFFKINATIIITIWERLKNASLQELRH
jgi:hypothetical protein